MTLVAAVFMAATTGIIGGEIILLGLVALPQMLRLGYDRNLAIGIDLRRRLARHHDPALDRADLLRPDRQRLDRRSVHRRGHAGAAAGRHLSGLHPGPLRPATRARPAVARRRARHAASRQVPPARRPDPADGHRVRRARRDLRRRSPRSPRRPRSASPARIFAAWVRGTLSWQLLRDCVQQTMSTCGLLLWLTFGATALIGVYNLLGGIRFIHDAMSEPAVRADRHRSCS